MRSDFIGDDEVSYLFLPLAHVFAQTVQVGSFEVGATIVFFGGDTKAVIPELTETHPTYFPSVPRIFEKLYTLVTSQAEPGQIEGAVKVGLRVRELEEAGEQVPEDLRAAYEEADEALFSKVRAIFGGEVRRAVSGAAPIAPEILAFFLAAGVPVLEGYGLTETNGVGTVNRLDAQKVGTVGQPMPGVEIRVADDGEVLMRGPNVFREYWGNPEATAEAKDADGWFHTGDLGSLDEDGFLRITGRKKDIIITAGGKNLTPANIENDLKQSRWISQAIMHGDRRPFPTALITLDEEEILPWAEEQGLPASIAELAREERVIELIQVELDRANSNYAQVEQIKKFFILEQDLSQEAGELTPTLKVKRNVINERYAERFEAALRLADRAALEDVEVDAGVAAGELALRGEGDPVPVGRERRQLMREAVDLLALGRDARPDRPLRLAVADVDVAEDVAGVGGHQLARRTRTRPAARCRRSPPERRSRCCRGLVAVRLDADPGDRPGRQVLDVDVPGLLVSPVMKGPASSALKATNRPLPETAGNLLVWLFVLFASLPSALRLTRTVVPFLTFRA